ncbi:MAG: VIT1/CCC1 transporter family protein [Proteobacteria bacterium]|nr:VIT1/CCC1 transporter family protein [Pseudomonadota bacterium]
MSATENWAEEMQSAYLYRVLAEVEPDPVKRTLFLRLSEVAESQAGIWVQQAHTQGATVPARFHPPLRARLVARLIRILGPRALRPVLAAIKVRGLSVYSASVRGHAMPTSVQDFGQRHRSTTSGGNLRAAVFGVSDGLVSNTSLIMGMAGAMHDLKVLLLTGAAGLLAGALSMAAGEYVSMRSQREMYEYQIGLEREELDEYPDEEAEELALIYQARGVPLEQARATAQSLLRNPEHALDTLAREELGLNPDELGSPWGAAVWSFLAFALGALVPLVPLWFAGPNAITISAGAAVVALFLVGAVLSLFTGKQALWGGLRLALIGGGAGVIAYLIGALLGAGLA